jgi:hypothetical protein
MRRLDYSSLDIPDLTLDGKKSTDLVEGVNGLLEVFSKEVDHLVQITQLDKNLVIKFVDFCIEYLWVRYDPRVTLEKQIQPFIVDPGISSHLDGNTFLDQVEDYFNVRIMDGDVYECSTLGGLLNYLQKKHIFIKTSPSQEQKLH